MIEIVTALAVSADSTKVVAHASKLQKAYSATSYVFVVRSNDGQYQWGPYTIVHGIEGKANLYVPGGGMVFDQYG